MRALALFFPVDPVPTNVDESLEKVREQLDKNICSRVKKSIHLAFTTVKERYRFYKALDQHQSPFRIPRKIEWGPGPGSTLLFTYPLCRNEG
jgi:hypothetical protein